MRKLSDSKSFAVISVSMLILSCYLAVLDKAYIGMFGNASYMVASIYKTENENSQQKRVQKKAEE
ncbi:hypothetical protein IQ274_31565 [Nostoc sp. LEGE 12447]|uniref:hypothetical protein n=1 Tax=Nostoc sp. LEGE 12447 TaxID=1828640 RepID=UPI0018832C09|nr:hypothetical protein [Nostoc sp. LEGE 12447]MBE9002602.1 hypothetical protein [Nostoc sp. LEGE 12447]